MHRTIRFNAEVQGAAPVVEKRADIPEGAIELGGRALELHNLGFNRRQVHER